jgi:threonine 3-dehydrogenase
MQALVKPKAGIGMELRDVSMPACGPNDVLIRVRHAGVCGTDLHIWNWDAWASGRLKPPVTIGHEFAGVITQLGPEAEATGVLAVGDEVTAEGHIVCGHCLQCRTGSSHVCRRTQIIGVDRDGAFADYIAMPESNVMKLQGIPTEIGAIMGCFAVGVARAAGASLVIASDLIERRLEIAQSMGAHVTLDAAKEDVTARILDLTGGEGVDVVCEMSGHPSGHAQAFTAARLGGRVNLLGTPSQTTEVDFARDIIFKGLTLYGVTGRRMYQTWHQMQRFLRGNQLDPLPVITHRFPLESFSEAIQVIKDGQAGKVILEIGA